MTNEEMFRRVTDALGELATVRHTLVEMQEELQKERVKSRWTEKNIEDAKTIKKMFPTDAKYVSRNVTGSYTITDKVGEPIIQIHTNLFPRMKVGEVVDLDEIIGGAE